jgi:hypothetical protein
VSKCLPRLRHQRRPLALPVPLTRVENGTVSATLATPADVVEVGKTIPFTLTITATDGANLTIPEIDQKLGEFDPPNRHDEEKLKEEKVNCHQRSTTTRLYDRRLRDQYLRTLRSKPH